MGKNFEDLKVWQKAIDLAEEVYRLTANFPSDEKYGLTSQLKRSSVSVSSNIAEGNARNSDKEFLRFLYIARGSLAEVKTQLIIAQRVGLTDQLELTSTFAQIDEISRMISGLRKTIYSRDSQLETRDYQGNNACQPNPKLVSHN